MVREYFWGGNIWVDDKKLLCKDLWVEDFKKRSSICKGFGVGMSLESIRGIDKDGVVGVCWLRG